MSRENVFEVLKRNDLCCNGINCELYRQFSESIEREQEIVEKITEYNKYIKNNTNKYSEEIMQFLRQIYSLNKYDFSRDNELNKLEPNEVFDHVVKWNGLLGYYSETIKNWIKEIYGVDLNEIKP